MPNPEQQAYSPVADGYIAEACAILEDSPLKHFDVLSVAWCALVASGEPYKGRMFAHSLALMGHPTIDSIQVANQLSLCSGIWSLNGTFSPGNEYFDTISHSLGRLIEYYPGVVTMVAHDESGALGLIAQDSLAGGKLVPAIEKALAKANIFDPEDAEAYSLYIEAEKIRILTARGQSLQAYDMLLVSELSRAQPATWLRLATSLPYNPEAEEAIIVIAKQVYGQDEQIGTHQAWTQLTKLMRLHWYDNLGMSLRTMNLSQPLPKELRRLLDEEHLKDFLNADHQTYPLFYPGLDPVLQVCAFMQMLSEGHEHQNGDILTKIRKILLQEEDNLSPTDRYRSWRDLSRISGNPDDYDKVKLYAQPILSQIYRGHLHDACVALDLDEVSGVLATVGRMHLISPKRPKAYPVLAGDAYTRYVSEAAVKGDVVVINRAFQQMDASGSGVSDQYRIIARAIAANTLTKGKGSKPPGYLFRLMGEYLLY